MKFIKFLLASKPVSFGFDGFIVFTFEFSEVSDSLLKVYHCLILTCFLFDIFNLTFERIAEQSCAHAVAYSLES